MPRYIDADKLKNTLVSSGAIGDFGQYLIDIRPAADVRPERHGQWDDSLDGITPFCTVCRMTHNCFNRTPKYCPHCGAKMDGEDGGSNG